MSDRCPCCGQALPQTETLIVDADALTVARRGAAVRITPTEMRFLAALNKKFPMTVRLQALMDELYWDKLEPPYDRVISVFASKLRPKLKPLGVGIAVSWGVGYRLELEN